MSSSPTPKREIRAKKVVVPKVWKRPHSTIYGKNVEFGSSLYSDKIGEINGRKFNSELPWQVRNSGGSTSVGSSSVSNQGYLSGSDQVGNSILSERPNGLYTKSSGVRAKSSRAECCDSQFSSAYLVGFGNTLDLFYPSCVRRPARGGSDTKDSLPSPPRRPTVVSEPANADYDLWIERTRRRAARLEADKVANQLTKNTQLLPKHQCQLSSSPYGQSADGRKLSLGSINPQSYRPSLPQKTTVAHSSDGEEFEFHDRSSPFYTDRWAGKTIRHFDSDLYSNANLFKSMIL